MARSYAKIHTEIWSDEDFKSLDPLYQHMFFVLLSQPRMNLCGVLDYIPRRIAGTSYELTVNEVEQRIGWLESKRYVVIDEDTSELLIRSFVRRDDMLKIKTVSQGMASDYGEVMSGKLRDAIEAELVRAYQEDPELAGWKGVEASNPVLMRRIREGSEKPRLRGIG